MLFIITTANALIASFYIMQVQQLSICVFVQSYEIPKKVLTNTLNGCIIVSSRTAQPNIKYGVKSYEMQQDNRRTQRRY